VVPQPVQPFLGRIAAAALLVAALVLAGCGRKSGLEEPPLAAAPDQPATAQTGKSAALGPDGKPLPPPPDKHRSFLDWLID
jgi:predicted small lipoprotein YifL